MTLFWNEAMPSNFLEDILKEIIGLQNFYRSGLS